MEVQPCLDAYAEWKRERGLADYADLLEIWLQSLRAGQPRPWKHLLVDEAQDLSPLQRALVVALCAEDGTGFFGIGDPDQAIYRFRGADADIAASLRQVWPGLRILSLDESHRASAAILEAGRDALGSLAVCTGLRSVTGRAATLHWLPAPTPEREIAWLADRVAYLVGGTSHQQADQRESLAGCHLSGGSCSPGDIAVLVRIKALMPPLRAALERRGIPCAIPEEEAFWTDTRVDMLMQGAALCLSGPSVPVMASLPPALRTVPATVWAQGPQAVVEKALSHAEGTFDPLFTSSPAFRKLEIAFREAGQDWSRLLAEVALKQEADLVRSRAEQVQIMTLHASKGLEFRAVFLPCLEDGLMPFYGVDALLGQSAVLTEEEREAVQAEERRLLYVGLTRAAEAVFASASARRNVYGHSLECAPCPFFPFSRFRVITLKRQVRVLSSQLSFFR